MNLDELYIEGEKFKLIIHRFLILQRSDGNIDNINLLSILKNTTIKKVTINLRFFCFIFIFNIKI
jgi:hypothetical protein